MPLRGDEVRACWQDGAVPMTPEPATPGLLDLLTVAALGEPRLGDDAPAMPAGRASDRADGADTRNRRAWVEVEA